MEHLILSGYIRLFKSLSINLRLRLLKALTESMKGTSNDFDQNKMLLFDELAGSWKDVDDEALIKDIYDNRTSSDRLVNFDD